MPTQVRNAPLDAFRSHEIPAGWAEDVIAAAAQMAEGDTPYNYPLTQRVGQQQWKKDGGGEWRAWDSSLRSVAELYSYTPDAVRRARAMSRGPAGALTTHEIQQAFMDSTWFLANFHTPPPPEEKGIPMPGRLPTGALEAIDALRAYPRTQNDRLRNMNRAMAMRQLYAQNEALMQILGLYGSDQ